MVVVGKGGGGRECETGVTSYGKLFKSVAYEVRFLGGSYTDLYVDKELKPDLAKLKKKKDPNQSETHLASDEVMGKE